MLNKKSFSALEHALLSSNQINLSRTTKKNEEASSYELTTVRGRHSGPTVVLARIELFYSSHTPREWHLRGIHGGQYTLKYGSNVALNGLKSYKCHQRTIPKHKTRIGL